MRLKAEVWVGAYVRRCSGAGLPVALIKRGAEEAGAIFIKVNRLDGTAEVLAPAPQTVFDESRPDERKWVRATGPEPVTETDADAYLARQRRFDPDLWIIEVESRDGDHLVEDVAD